MALDQPDDTPPLATEVAERATELAAGRVPAGRRWTHTFQLHQLTGRLLRDTPDDRPADDVGQPPRGEP